MLKLLFVGIGGAIGACLRYLISSGTANVSGSPFPFGTLIVNVLGGFLIGILMELGALTDWLSPNAKAFLITGVLGGLTTFSTFSYETIALFQSGNVLTGAWNVGLNLILSLIGVVVGKAATAQFV